MVGHVVEGYVGISVVLGDERLGLADHRAVAVGALPVPKADGLLQHLPADGQHFLQLHHLAPHLLIAQGLGDHLLRRAAGLLDHPGGGQQYVHEHVIGHHHGLGRRLPHAGHVVLQDGVHVLRSRVAQLFRDGGHVQVDQGKARVGDHVLHVHDAGDGPLVIQLAHDHPGVGKGVRDIRYIGHRVADGHQQFSFGIALYIVLGGLGQAVGPLLQVPFVVPQHKKGELFPALAQVGGSPGHVRQALQYAAHLEQLVPHRHRLGGP